MAYFRIALLSVLLVLGFSSGVHAIESTQPLVMTEIHPRVGATETPFIDKEYVELYNPNATAVSLDDYQLNHCDTSNKAIAISEASIQPYEYLVVKSSTALLDTNGCVVFSQKVADTATELQRVSYTNEIPAGGESSIALYKDGWKVETMSPGKDSPEVAPVVQESRVLELTELSSTFVEFYNPNDSELSTEGYMLRTIRGGVTKEVALPNIQLATHAYGAVELAEGALKQGDVFEVYAPNGKVVSSANVGADIPELYTWAVAETGWQTTMTATPSAQNAIAVPSTKPIELSEILPNPDGDDTGNEWLEIHNATSEDIDIWNYHLEIKGKTYPLATQSRLVKAGEYVQIMAADIGASFTNTQETVVLRASAGNEVSRTSYQSAPSGESWANVADTWMFTAHTTPNAENIVWNQEGNGAISVSDMHDDEPAPCPAGKYRNPATGRCKNIEVDAPLKLCGPGQYRNPATGRCKNIATATTARALKPCGPGEYRNPATGRCKKYEVAKQLEPCRPGYERNPETNRCRKIANVLAASTDKAPFAVEPIADSPKATNVWWIIGGVFGAGALYAAWEWRSAFASLGRKIVSKGKSS